MLPFLPRPEPEPCGPERGCAAPGWRLPTEWLRLRQDASASSTPIAILLRPHTHSARDRASHARLLQAANFLDPHKLAWHSTSPKCARPQCGGYLWDHRNASLQKFLIDEFMLGPTGLGSSAISGFFIDGERTTTAPSLLRSHWIFLSQRGLGWAAQFPVDFWCSDLLCKDLGCSCGDPRQGPSEIVNTSQADMGLTDRDIKDITIAWNNTMGMVERATLEKGGYTWSLMRGENNANASPQMLANKASVGHRLRCAAQLKEACMATSIFQTTANLFGVTFNSSTLELTQLEQDVAFFLLARGEYAWIGWGTWGMTWPFNAEPAHGTLPALPHGVPKPPLLSRDFGAPVDKACRPVSPGVFERRWTKGVVQLDCNTFTATLPE